MLILNGRLIYIFFSKLGKSEQIPVLMVTQQPLKGLLYAHPQLLIYIIQYRFRKEKLMATTKKKDTLPPTHTRTNNMSGKTLFELNSQLNKQKKKKKKGEKFIRKKKKKRKVLFYTPHNFATTGLMLHKHRYIKKKKILPKTTVSVSVSGAYISCKLETKSKTPASLAIRCCNADATCFHIPSSLSNPQTQ